MPHNKKIIFSLFIILISIIFILYLYYNSRPSVSFNKVSFSQLPHWKQEDLTNAFLAFKHSCTEILKRNPYIALNHIMQSGTVETSQMICNAAIKINQPNPINTKEFFETWFQPYSVKSNLTNDHLFTGYYIPLLHANLKKDHKYTIPIYGLPRDLIKINLSSFNNHLPNKTLIGKLQKDHLIPYPDRTAISHGIIINSAPILAWADNPMDVFFAQIQGSMFIELPNKQKLLLGYAGTNGHPYTAIGKVLLEKNILKKDEISMQSIRAWFEKNPDQLSPILNCNASYIFFKWLTIQEPIGTEGVPLTPGRSLAVDTHYISLGTPIWLSTSIPSNNDNKLEPFQHLLIAQDTGGAIKGAVRGDIYWGTGEEAAFLAGHMQSTGQYWILLPKKS
jgi:membrane-bound lytic murein transglycosylase A